MITMNDLLAEFNQGLINKPEFIRKMYELRHSVLFEYAFYLAKTNIKKIEIEDGKVIMTSRDRGVRMFCVPDDYRLAPIETLNFFDYEKNDSAMIENLVKDGDVFFDIGSNVGWYSINIALSRRNSKVYCFEPIKKTYDYLLQNIALNGLTNITPHNFGFSDKEGSFDFFYYKEGSGNASQANLSDRDDVEKCECELKTLDGCFKEFKTSIDFIKCDVEGGELLVYRGGKETLTKNLPIVFSEVLRKWSAKFNYNPNEIFELFRSLNYKVFTTEGDKLREFSVMDENTLETNFFFLHTEKHKNIIDMYVRDVRK